MANQSNSITNIFARQILDSRGQPTIEVDLTTGKGVFRAAVPSGASTGIYEALELRDGDKSKFNGKGVLTAVSNVNKIIGPALKGMDVTDQAGIDKKMVEELDGSKNEWGWSKSKLGANAILSVSMAVCRAGAAAKDMPLFKYIATLANKPTNKFILPVPSFNVINGGSHAGNTLAMQEFMILPVGAHTFAEALRYGAEVYSALKTLVKKKYGMDATNVGDEGGFAPNCASSSDALDLIVEAIKASGHEGKVKIGTDVAASEFYVKETKKYDLDFKNPKSDPSKHLTGDELIAMYEGWVNDGKYPMISIEDPFDQDDFSNFTKLTKSLGEKAQIVGDDLLVTNPSRIEMAIDKKACNSLLLKVNQIGSITEAIKATNMCMDKKFSVMQSHRSGVRPNISHKIKKTQKFHKFHKFHKFPKNQTIVFFPGNGGRLYRGYVRRHVHWPDQDGRPLPLRASGQIQPASSH